MWDTEHAPELMALSKTIEDRCPGLDYATIELLVEDTFDNNEKDRLETLNAVSQTWYAVIDEFSTVKILGAKNKECLARSIIEYFDGAVGFLTEYIAGIYHDGHEVLWELALRIED
jgi:hypothetical protein